MKPGTPQRSIEDLCPELRALVAAELAAGNAVIECRPGLYGPEALLVLLDGPFRCAPATPPSGVEFREINDPHWWKAEYFHVATKDAVAARY